MPRKMDAAPALMVRTMLLHRTTWRLRRRNKGLNESRSVPNTNANRMKPIKSPELCSTTPTLRSSRIIP